MLCYHLVYVLLVTSRDTQKLTNNIFFSSPFAQLKFMGSVSEKLRTDIGRQLVASVTGLLFDKMFLQV